MKKSDEGNEFILVDITGFRVRLYRGGRPVLTMRAIVGSPAHPTPPFTARLNRIVVNPTWVLPREIAVEEALPELTEDPSLFEESGIDVYRRGQRIDPDGIDWRRVTPDHFPYELKQRPGADNPLGTFKFSFDNPYSVFLHGTADRGFFFATRRAMSHGCVRIEDPFALALAILSEWRTDWSAERLLALVREGREVALDLPYSIPVFFVYATSWVEENGRLVRRKDIYGRENMSSSPSRVVTQAR